MRGFLLVQLPLIAAVTMGVNSCEPKPDPYPVSGQECHRARDQLLTFAVRVQTLPVKIFVDPAFSKGQVEDIRAMAGQWNAFGTSSLGLTFFEVVAGERADFARMFRGSKYCDDGVARLPGIALVREESRSGWDAEQLGADAEGVTRRCSVGKAADGGNAGTPAEMQIVVDSERMPLDGLRSIVLHELGHALGLGHSCVLDSKQSSKYLRACEELHSDDPYRVAVMYPSLEVRGSSTTDQLARVMAKEVLRANDLERAYCLYRR